MQKILLVFLFIGFRLYSQVPDEKRDTMFLVFDAKLYKWITLSKAEDKGKLHYRFEWSSDKPVNSVELVTDKKRSKVTINNKKLWGPREGYGISWFAEDLNNTKVIYIIEQVNNKQKARKVLKVSPHIIYL